MAMHFPLYPMDLGKNSCYLQMIEDYKRGIDTWDKHKLQKTHTPEQVKVLQDNKFLKPVYDEQLSLAFKIFGTPSAIVLNFLNENLELFAFHELRRALPSHIQSSNKLKNYLVYLVNFDQIQVITLPGCAVTLVGLDQDEGKLSDEIDLIFDVSLLIESKLRYLMNPEEGANELNFLCSPLPNLTYDATRQILIQQSSLGS